MINVGIIVGLLSFNFGYSVSFKTNIRGPAVKDKPFVVVWNVASELCSNKFGIDLNLHHFGIVENPSKTWQGDDIMIYYINMFGLLPHYVSNGTAINGGLPQYGNWQAHVKKTFDDIDSSIPNVDFQGPAVIDWESWHPLYKRMGWGNYKQYQKHSIEKVQQEHPTWNETKIAQVANEEYDYAAKLYMAGSLEIAKYLRPKGLWGFYLYPDCYNYKWAPLQYQCSNSTKTYNDEIQWLFDASTGIYPSLYFSESQANNYTTFFYAYNRIYEALRLDHNRPDVISVPVLPYHGLVYRLTTKFLSLQDLHESIGVGALLGTSGMIIWGDHFVANSTETCMSLKSYISTTLGPYCKETSDSASDCSLNMCSGHGRCVVQPLGNKNRQLSKVEALKIIMLANNKPFKHKILKNLGYTIKCQCFQHWYGEKCDFL